MPIISMLYTTHRGGRKSLEEDKEAAWFLNHMVDDNMVFAQPLLPLLSLLKFIGGSGSPRSSQRWRLANTIMTTHPSTYPPIKRLDPDDLRDESVSDFPFFYPIACHPPPQLLLDYVHKSGQDKRNRSRTRGAKHPAFALFVNEKDHHIVIAVRGTQDKNDHLTDLDLADCQLSDKDPCGVHRGMLNGARYILDEWGLLPFLKTAPSTYSIRLVGHSLGAGPRQNSPISPQSPSLSLSSLPPSSPFSHSRSLNFSQLTLVLTSTPNPKPLKLNPVL
jgi:hypothetical protein